MKIRPLYIAFALFALLSGLILGGCKVSKDLELPDTQLPKSFNGLKSTDTTSVGDLPWRQLFPEPELRELINLALTKNYDLQIAVKNIESATLLLNQTKWGYAPDLSFQIGASSNTPSGNSLNGVNINRFLGSNSVQNFTAGFALSWEADIWGKVKNQKQSAKASLQQSEELRKLLQTQVVAAVAQSYYNLLMLDRQLAIARQNLALADSTLLVVRLQFEAGIVTDLAVQQSQAQQLAVAQLIPQFEQNIALQENALNALMGTMPTSIARTADFDALPLPDSLSAGVPAGLLARRPDVRTLELALTIANARVGLRTADLYPTLRITASTGVNAFKLSTWFSLPTSIFALVEGGLVQPILQRKQLKTQLELAKIEREQVVIRFRQGVLNAVREVSDALICLEQLQVQYALAEQRTQTLMKAKTTAMTLFKSGLATYLEVILAQSNLLQSQLELAAIKRAQLSASVELYRALGGGWK